jgi:hypothetical protein
MNLRATLSDRFIPILTLLLLSTPLSYIGTIFHEEGHGFLALAQGGTFTGIVIGQNEAFALANSYLVSIGGWIGQYVLLVIVLGLSWRLKPKSFLARSAIAMLVLHETIDEPAYIASLQGDSAGTLQVLEATGIGRGASVAILESIALVLLAFGAWLSWRVFRTYFMQVFPWVERRRSGLASILFVVLAIATVFAVLAPKEVSVLATNGISQALVFVAVLMAISFIAIPPAPQAWQRPKDWGGRYPAFAFVLLLLAETELVYFFVLPITIPFP